MGGGYIPDTWRILNNLIARLEDPKTGNVIEDFHVEIPEESYEEAKVIGSVLGPTLPKMFGIVEGAHLISADNPAEGYLNNTWRPCLTITAVDGLPKTTNAGSSRKVGGSRRKVSFDGRRILEGKASQESRQSFRVPE